MLFGASLFQSTRPVRGRDTSFAMLRFVNFHFNPRAPCGGATPRPRLYGQRLHISIHAPRAGARRGVHHLGAVDLRISIHAPRAGARLPDVIATEVTVLFQSTRPVRGRDSMQVSGFRIYFLISIHAPRAGARLFHKQLSPSIIDFNPRAPCGGATGFPAGRAFTGCISIHAPRAGARPLA